MIRSLVSNFSNCSTVLKSTLEYLVNSVELTIIKISRFTIDLRTYPKFRYLPMYDSTLYEMYLKFVFSRAGASSLIHIVRPQQLTDFGNSILSFHIIPFPIKKYIMLWKSFINTYVLSCFIVFQFVQLSNLMPGVILALRIKILQIKFYQIVFTKTKG